MPVRPADKIQLNGQLVWLVGGTGLYIRAFLHGIIEGGAADLALREQLEKEAAEARQAGDAELLHRRLREKDPEAAEKIHPNDERRLIRALELHGRGQGGASALRKEHQFQETPYRSLYVALDPGVALLDERINQRCQHMIDSGLLQELREVYDRGYSADLPALQSIGYRHLAPVAAGSETLRNALAAMQRDTRRFARRQRTWLRAIKEAHWHHPEDESLLERRLKDFLAVAK